MIRIIIKNHVNQRGVVIISPLIVSNNFLRRAFFENESITPMKLQKLLYFLYSKYLYTYNFNLFPDRFEVWRYGPVLSVVYHYFKDYLANNIDEYAKIKNEILEVDETYKPFRESINMVWGKYGGLTGTELSNFTNQKNTAWYKADARGDAFLQEEEIKEDGEIFFG